MNNNPDNLQYQAKQQIFDAEIEDKYGSLENMHKAFREAVMSLDFQERQAEILSDIDQNKTNGIDNPKRAKR